MKNIYCISGLGADHRIFANLSIPGAKLVHLPWVPHDKHDEIGCYAQKMITQIPEQRPVIIGLSFGGMVGVEIAKQIEVERLFLVSSAKGKMELPDVGGSLKFLVKHSLIPYGLFTKPNQILYKRFGATEKEDKDILDAIMKDTDPDFLGWAFKAILAWQNEAVPERLVHIHGTEDRIIPPASIDASYWINHGSHMMMYNRAEEIAPLIKKHL